MLYLLTIQFEKPKVVKKSDIYYAILGGILSLFDDEKKVYDSILKLSFSLHEELVVQISIQGEESYQYIVNALLKQQETLISINGLVFKLKQLRFNFEIFKTQEIQNSFDKFILKFYSPTFTKLGDTICTLPNPDVFLRSLVNKMNKITNYEIQDTQFKLWLKKNIYTGEMHLDTTVVSIKKGKKIGVIGECTYYLKNTENIEFLKVLYQALQNIRFFGIGNSTKLGCGNVGCFITNK